MLLLYSFVLACLAAVDASSLDIRDQLLLADGNGLQTGRINGNLSWQSTGVLYQGCKDSEAHPIHISDCYALQLSGNENENLEPGNKSPRQRIEFLTPPAAAGTTHKFKWRFYLSSVTGTTDHFFHIMQVLTRGGNGGPVVTLDAVKGQIAIKDVVRDCAQTKCPSIPLSDFTDRTTVHFVTVTYGSQGSLRYVVQDADNGHMELLRYQVTGEMGEDASIKFGTYRAAVEGMTVSRAALGDFVVEQ